MKIYKIGGKEYIKEILSAANCAGCVLNIKKSMDPIYCGHPNMKNENYIELKCEDYNGTSYVFKDIPLKDKLDVL